MRLTIFLSTVALAACTSAPEPDADTSTAEANASEVPSWFLVESPDADGDGVPELRVTNGRPLVHGGLYFGDDAFRWVRFLSGKAYGPMPTDPNWPTLELGPDYVRFDPATGALEKHGTAADLTWTVRALGNDLLITHPKAVDAAGTSFKHGLVLADGNSQRVQIGPFLDE